MVGLEAMFGVWGCPAGLKRKSSIALEFRAAPRVAQSLEVVC